MSPSNTQYHMNMHIVVEALAIAAAAAATGLIPSMLIVSGAHS